MSGDKLKSCEAIKVKFEGHFLHHMNVIFGRTNFNRSIHVRNEYTEMLITNLQKLADTGYNLSKRPYSVPHGRGTARKLKAGLEVNAPKRKNGITGFG